MKRNTILYLGIAMIVCGMTGAILKMGHVQYADEFMIATLVFAGLFGISILYSLARI